MKNSKGYFIGVATMAVLTISAVFYLGCDRGDKITSSNMMQPTETTPSRDVYTTVDCETGKTTEVLSPSFEIYGSANAAEFQMILNNVEVRGTIAKFDSLGYALDLPASYIMQGIGIPDGSTDSIGVRIVSVIMRYLPDSTKGFIWINHIRSTDHPALRSFVQSAIWAFVLPENPVDYKRWDAGPDENNQMRYIWTKEIILPFGSPEDPSIAAMKPMFNWRKWLGCTVAGTLGGSATAAVGCIASGPGWGACTALWSGGALLGSAIACAVGQLIS